jgi:sigma-B regulation protein RsbU (phosphoserine phosphatase)
VYVNAGHPPACLVREGRLTQLESTGIPFGVLPNFPYDCARVTLEPGDLLAIFSDGIPEAQNGDEFFDFDRLSAVLREQGDVADLEVARRNVLARVEAFVNGAPRTDDITLVLMRRAFGLRA